MFPIAANRSDEENTTPYSDDVFSTTLYTGNGSTQTITNGIDLAGKGGLVWFKDRTAAGNHLLFDTSRGATKSLGSNTAGSQADATNALTSFNSNGFVIGASNEINWNSTRNYASWTFRKAAKFFDVVTYTGNGVAGRTVAHSLGVAPGMIIVKSTSALGSWVVYNRGVNGGTNPQNYGLTLNVAAAQYAFTNFWNNTAPTASVFTVGASTGETNETGVTYVAYLFAHDTSSTGIIQCGSYTTDASGNATVNLGWEPQYVMYKIISSSGNDWEINDSMRGLSNTTWRPLRANTANAESNYDSYTATQGIKPTSTGFTLQADVPSATYIYMAIRMPNKPPTSGTQVYNAIARTATQATLPVTSIGFPPDLIINGVRSNANYGQQVTDRLRGVTKQVFTEYDSAENTTNGTALVSLDMSGFTLGSDTAGTGWNAYTGYTSVKWNFKRAPGFFDEVCYTGDNVANRQIIHNLGVAPELTIVKRRTSGTANWIVRAISDRLILNSSGISGGSNGTITNTSATTFTVTEGAGDFQAANASGSTYVAYLFATLAGISKVGSYTGNGSSQNIECGFAAGARFFLVKATSTTGSWWVWDSARGITSGNDPALQLNSTAAEITTADAVDPYSPGITVNQEATCSINASGVSYVYLAIS